MEEKQKNGVNGEKNPLIYIALILSAMMIIGFASLYVPILIFLLIVFAPAVLSYDMKQSTPMLSAGLLIVSVIFLYFNQFDFALYKILVLSTGASALLCFMVWRLFSLKKFSDGISYSILLSVLFGIITALVIFIMRDRVSFAEEIVVSLENWMRTKEPLIVDSLYSNYVILYSDEFASAETLGEMMNIIFGRVDTLTSSQKITAFMPMVQSMVNRYSLSALIMYPAFAGVITWWRGNVRFYKDEPVNEENKDMKPKPFSTFSIPRWLFLAIAFLLILSFMLQISGYGEVIFNAAVLMQNFAYMLIILQGLAVMEYFMKRSRILKNGYVRIVLMALVTFITTGVFTVFVGGVDLFINIRMAFSKSQEMKESMKKNAEKKRDNDDKENKDK